VDTRTLIYEDNFDGSLVNTANWNPYYGSGHAGNGLRRPSAVSQRDGLLTITAKSEGGEIVSGGMSNRLNFQYGSVEFRVRTDRDPTAQMSGVVLTWPKSGKKVPDGENDIYETSYSLARNPFYSYVHYTLDGITGKQYRFVHSADATQWHVMRMDWSATEMKFYRYGVLTHTLTNPAAIPDNPHHAAIQLDARFEKAAVTTPVKMEVDWIRIYK